MKVSRENQVMISLEEITKIVKRIYKELERQESYKNEELIRKSDRKVQDMLYEIREEAGSIYRAL